MNTDNQEKFYEAWDKHFIPSKHQKLCNSIIEVAHSYYGIVLHSIEATVIWESYCKSAGIDSDDETNFELSESEIILMIDKFTDKSMKKHIHKDYGEDNVIDNN